MSITEKQAYLRENILDKGHSQEAFASFLEEKYPDGFDLASLEMEELEALVTEFSNEAPRERQNTNLSIDIVFGAEKKSDMTEEHESSSESEESEEHHSEQEAPEKPEKKYSATKNVKAYPITEIQADQKLVIVVENPERVASKGLMGGKHTEFTVKTMPLGWEVKRRYNDFDWLHKCLEKLFPAHYVLFF
jgi:hypothetical protein